MKRFSASLEPSSKNTKASPEKNQVAQGSIIKIVQGQSSKQSTSGESPHNKGGSSECVKTISNEKKPVSRRISIDTKSNNKILSKNQKGTSTATNFTSLHYHYVPYQQSKQNYQNFMKRTSNNTYINCSDASNRSAPLHLKINYQVANNKSSSNPSEVDDIMSLHFPIQNTQGVAGNLSLSSLKVSDKNKNNQQVNVEQINGQKDIDKEDTEKSKRISLVVKRNLFHKSQKKSSPQEQTSNDDTSSISYFGTRMSTGQILQSTPSSKHTSNKFASIETLKDNYGFSSSSSEIIGQGEQQSEKIEDTQQIGVFSRTSYLNLAINTAKQEGSIQSKECSLKYYGLGEHNHTNNGKITPTQVCKETCTENQDFNKSKTNPNYQPTNSPGSILHNEFLSKQLSEDCQGSARTDNTELNKAFVKGIMQKKQQIAGLTKRQNNFVDADSNNLEDRVDYLQFVTPGCTTPLRNQSVDSKNTGSLAKIQMEEVLSSSKEVQKQAKQQQNSSQTVLALSQGLLQQHQGFSSPFIQRSETFLQDIEQKQPKQQGVNVRLASQSQTQFPAAVTPKVKSKTDLKSSLIDVKDNLTASRFNSQRTSQSFSLGIIPKDSKIQPVQGFPQFLDSQGVFSPPGSCRMPQASTSHMLNGKDKALQSNSPKSQRVSFFSRNSSMASTMQISHAGSYNHNNPLMNQNKQFLILTPPPPSFVPPSHLIKQKSLTPGRKDIGSLQEIHCAESAVFRKIQPMKEPGIDILLKIKGKQKDNLLSKCDFNFAKHRLVSSQIQQTKVRLFKQNLI